MIFQLFTKSTTELSALASSTAPVVLLQDGVYAGVELCPSFSNLYVLENDLRASGLSIDDYPQKIKRINHTEWVSLCAEFAPVISLS